MDAQAIDEAQRTVLPAALTSFIGRDAELATLQELVRSNRLVTLLGVGGCGKTRLALEVAARSAIDFEEGARLAELAPIQEAELVVDVVAAALDAPLTPGRAAVDAIAAAVGRRQVLLVLDNCEHVVDAAASLLADLLGRCPRLSVLATSREPVGVAGELTFTVPSLQIEDDAVALFTERATRVRPDLDLDDGDRAVAEDICRRLDGLPLAIELAAARVRALSLPQIAGGLEHRFELLSSGPRTVLPRHQTLRGSVEWSHDLLTEEERVVLRRLSVFRGGFDLEGVVAVAAEPGQTPVGVTDTLASLVDKSLVQADDAGDEVRYRLLETIRQYAAERLDDADEAAPIAARHRDHVRSILARARAEEEGPDQARWRQRVVAELDNVRSALASADRDGDHASLLEITCGAGNTWTISGQSHEHRRWLQLAISSSPPDTPLRGSALYQLAITDESVGDWVSALDHLEQAVPEYRRAGDSVGALWAESERNFVTGMTRGLDAVEDGFAAAEAEAEENGASGARYSMTYNRGALLQMCGRFAEARDVFAPTVDGPTPVRHFGQWMRALLGWTLAELGRIRQGAVHLEPVLAYGQAEGDGMATHMASVGLTGCRLFAGDLSAAEAIAADCASRSSRFGPFHHSLLTLERGRVALAAGEAAAAIDLLAPTIDVVASIHRPSAVPLQTVLADALALDGEFDAARTVLTAALAIDPDPRSAHTAGALVARARIDRASGNSAASADAAHEALAIYTAMEHLRGTVDALELVAAGALDRHAPDDAARLLGAADALRQGEGLAIWHPGQGAARNDAIEAARDELGADEFDACWAAGRERTVDEACALAGRTRGRRGRGSRPATGWEALTPAEVKVAELVAKGLTNAKVGEQLFISRHTVDSHLRHIYAKLGVSTRAELARAAPRQDGVDA